MTEIFYRIPGRDTSASSSGLFSSWIPMEEFGCARAETSSTAWTAGYAGVSVRNNFLCQHYAPLCCDVSVLSACRIWLHGQV